MKVRDYLSEVQWGREINNRIMELIYQKCSYVMEKFIPFNREMDEKREVYSWFNRECREAKERTRKVQKLRSNLKTTIQQRLRPI